MCNVDLVSSRFTRGYLSRAMLGSLCCGRIGNVTTGLAKGTSSMLGLTFGRSPWFTRQLPGPPPPQLIQCRGIKERHKKIIKMAKGYRARTNCYRIAIGRVEKALQYQYRDRKVQKRDWRKLWIHRITAAVKQYRLTYSRFIPGLRAANINLNRKILADLAVTEPYSFKSVVDTVKSTPQVAWDKTHLSVHR